MSDDQDQPAALKEILVEEKAGYLVLRLKSGSGVIISENIEIRLCSVSRTKDQAELAIRAPKSVIIRRLK